jgi:hypothetical protein
MTNFLSIDIETWAYGDTPGLRALTSAQRKAADAGYVLDSTRRVLALVSGAVVFGNVPDFAVASGNPARVIRTLTPPEGEG